MNGTQRRVAGRRGADVQVNDGHAGRVERRHAAVHRSPVITDRELVGHSFDQHVARCS